MPKQEPKTCLYAGTIQRTGWPIYLSFTRSKASADGLCIQWHSNAEGTELPHPIDRERIESKIVWDPILSIQWSHRTDAQGGWLPYRIGIGKLERREILRDSWLRLGNNATQYGPGASVDESNDNRIDRLAQGDASGLVGSDRAESQLPNNEAERVIQGNASGIHRSDDIRSQPFMSSGNRRGRLYAKLEAQFGAGRALITRCEPDLFDDEDDRERLRRFCYPGLGKTTDFSGQKN